MNLVSTCFLKQLFPLPKNQSLSNTIIWYRLYLKLPQWMHILVVLMETLLNNSFLCFLYEALATTATSHELDELWPSWFDITYFERHCKTATQSLCKKQTRMSYLVTTWCVYTLFGLPKDFAKPKSANFKTPFSSNNKLFGLRSCQYREKRVKSASVDKNI